MELKGLKAAIMIVRRYTLREECNNNSHPWTGRGQKGRKDTARQNPRALENLMPLIAFMTMLSKSKTLPIVIKDNPKVRLNPNITPVLFDFCIGEMRFQAVCSEKGECTLSENKKSKRIDPSNVSSSRVLASSQPEDMIRYIVTYLKKHHDTPKANEIVKAALNALNITLPEKRENLQSRIQPLEL